MKNTFYCSLLLILLFITRINSQTIDATLLELNFSNDGNPEKFTKVDNGFFFSSQDDQLWFSNGTNENTFLVKDFASGTYDDITYLTPLGTKVFFVAENGNDNRELWVSDGTEDGTIKLTSRNVSSSTENIYNIIEYKGKIYFGAYSEIFGNELWVSDGTPDGTFVLKDINENGNSTPKDFFVFKEKLYFKAYTETYDYELWVTDGQPEGTTIFKDINETGQSIQYTEGYITYGEHFYFFANDGSNLGEELWKSDGTASGTELLKDIYDGYFSSGSKMKGAVINNKLIFSANDGIHGTELWETDGTLEGTILFKDINPGTYWGFSSYDGILNLVGDKLFFSASDDGDQDGLWVTDGVSENTFFLNEGTPKLLSGSMTDSLIIYFINHVLWKSDGTINGTTILSEDIESINSSILEQSFVSYGGNIYFNGENEKNGNELWLTDGTTEGTKIFYDLNSSYGVSPSLLTAVGDQLFFRGNQYGYYGLCNSDGTIEGTKYLDINLDGQSIDDESEFIDFNGKLVVSANDGVHGYELWISDGTQNGTKMIKDINPGSESSMYNFEHTKTLTVIDDKLYFMADDGVHGYQLWVTDGNEAGTHRISEINALGGFTGARIVDNIVSYNGFIYFSAFDNGNVGEALFRTDGQLSGTSRVRNLHEIESINVVNEKLVIVAETSNTTYGPHDLWVSDGTYSGTSHLMSFGDGISSSIRNVYKFNNNLFFGAKNPNDGDFGLYKTDGTLDGTLKIYGAPGTIFGECGNYLYFNGSNYSLMRYDGNNIESVNPDADISNGGTTLCFNNNFYYVDDNRQLNIITDELSNKTTLDIQVNGGQEFSDYSSLFNLTASRNYIYFSGRTNFSGEEIFVMSPNLSILNINDDSNKDVNFDMFNIYPNPVSEGLINIVISNKNIIIGFEIYDLSGKKLINKSNENLLELNKIDVRFLSSGIYLLKLNILDRGILSTKFIIK